MLATTFDGASVNCRLVKLHDTSVEVHKVRNVHASDGRDLFFFSDHPHLLKTTRNCWSSKSRTLWVCNIYIFLVVNILHKIYYAEGSMLHIMAASGYDKDKGKGSGLSLVPKLKFEHINLSSFSRMRVDLAAQVSCTNNYCSIEIK